jgi:23S rRNA (cytosine1962-C5)-methyltransferase
MQALLNTIRDAVIPDDAQRLFHGRGGMHADCAQWSLDVYPPVWVLTSFKHMSDAALDAVDVALRERWARQNVAADLCWVYQCRESGFAETRLMAGQVPDPHIVTESGLRYMAGNTHGNVLNLFAYTCAFSVAAKAGGAGQVINIDMSGGAIGVGQQNHHLNEQADGVAFLAHDIFKSWGKLKRGAPYDLIIVDPPSYQKGSFIATKDYAKLIRRLPDLLANDANVLLCLNAPELDVAFLMAQVAENAPALQWVERVANPEVFADVSPDRALKVLVYRMQPGIETAG